MCLLVENREKTDLEKMNAINLPGAMHSQQLLSQI